MPGGPKPAKNIQRQQQHQKQQQVDRPRGQDKKQVNKLLENPKQGKPQVDKRQAGPKGDGGKNFGDYLKDNDRNRPDGGKTADDDKKDGKDRDRPGLGDYLKDKDRGRLDDGKHADDDKDDKGGKDGKDHNGDGKHAGDKYDGKHDGKGGHKDPVLVDCKHPYVWKRGKGCVRPGGHDQAYCGWPMVRIGNSCVCGPGFISRHGDCYRPPVVVVVPSGPGYVPGGPGYLPVGPEPDYPDGPPPGAGPGPGGPADDYPPQEASPASPPRQPAEPVALIDPVSNARCLPGDLYDLLEETYGKRPSLDRCPAACLPKPASFTEAELDAAAEKSGINWCDNCVQVGGYMPLASVLTLERAANVTLCVNPDMCRLPASIGGPASGVEKVTEIRTIFKDLPAGTKNDGNIAVIVGNKDYQGDLPDNPDGSADADAVMALLIDQLGYKQENIIDLRDATLEDLERVFGSDKDPEGELAGRIDKKDPGDVFIYVASHGMVKEDDAKQAYLLPVDAKLDDLDKTAYPLQELYEHLGKIGARTIMLMLEANFAKNLDELIDPPNLPELEVEAMPVDPVPGLAVFKASDRDQKTIKDPEYGIGLFTRYLIEGLAGRADAAPLGNDDKRIDTVELYVYTADAVRTAARKSFGLEQKPMLGKIDNLVVGNLSSN
jgi:Caspase domain